MKTRRLSKNAWGSISFKINDKIKIFIKFQFLFFSFLTILKFIMFSTPHIIKIVSFIAKNTLLSIFKEFVILREKCLNPTCIIPFVMSTLKQYKIQKELLSTVSQFDQTWTEGKEKLKNNRVKTRATVVRSIFHSVTTRSFFFYLE